MFVIFIERLVYDEYSTNDWGLSGLYLSFLDWKISFPFAQGVVLEADLG